MDSTSTKDPRAWKEVISSEVPLFYFPYKEIWKQKFLLYLLVRQYFVIRYKQTILGPIWVIIQPLLSTAVFVIVFSKILNVSTGGVPPILFYLLGNTIWLFFSTSFLRTAIFLTSEENILKKVNIVKQLFPISYIIFNSITSGIQFFVFVIFWIYYLITTPIQMNIYIFLVPFMYIILIIFTLGIGYIFSFLSSKYRDLMGLYTYFMQFAIYITPVIYPLHTLEGKKRFFLQLNPLSAIFEFTRYGFFGEGYISWWMLLYSLCFSILSFVVGLFLLARIEKVYTDII